MTFSKTLILVLLITGTVISNIQAQNATEVLSKAYQAHGGEYWEDISLVSFDFLGHRYWMEQSENPDGPFIVSYNEGKRIHSTVRSEVYIEEVSNSFQRADSPTIKYTLNGKAGMMKVPGRSISMSGLFMGEFDFQLNIAPERLLLQANKAEVELLSSKLFGGVNHYRIAYKDESGFQKILWINGNTFLISKAEVETYLPYDFFFSVWGTFKTEITYSLYSYFPDKQLRYPLQWDIFRLGHKWKSMTLLNPAFKIQSPDTLFSIPEEIAKAAESARGFKVNETPFNTNQASEIAPGITQIPGFWNIVIVEQQSGITVIDAPISSGFSTQVIDFVQQKYPGKEIDQVILGADAWPHLAGIREYAANDITLVSHALNKPLIERILNADYSFEPDSYSSNKSKDYQAIFVDTPLEMKDSDNFFEVFPIDGEGGERMLAVYFPSLKFLYAGDLIQPLPSGGFYFPQYLTEVKNLIEREELIVEQVFAMHAPLTEWSDIEDFLKTQN